MSHIWMVIGPKTVLYTILTALLFVFLACGGSATSIPEATGAPASSVSTPVPTQAEAMAGQPVTASGKVTMMVADWGTQSFEPRDASGQIMTQHRMIHGWLIAGNKDTQFIPGIAESWELSPDGLQWTWTIRDGVKFQNGEDLTVEDVLFSLDRHHGPEAVTGAVHGIFIQQAKSTVSQVITGPNTIVVTQKPPPNASYPFLMSQLHSSDAHGAMLPKDYWEEVGGKEGYEKAPVGAGALQVVEFKPSEQILLERFDGYYFTPENGFPEDRRMKFQTLDARLVPEESTRVSALRAGQADLIEASLNARNQVEAGGGRLIFIPEASYSQVNYVGCYIPEVWCSDKRVRFALDYAVDKELIRDLLYGGTEVARLGGYQAATPNALGYSPELDSLPFDPEKARQLLADAGYPGGKGFPPFTMHTWDGGDVPLQPQQAELIADMWEKNLGLDVTVRVGDPTGIRQEFRNGDLVGDLYFRSNEARFDGGSMVRNRHNPENPTRLSEDLTLHAAAKEALAVVDPELRQAAYNKMYRLMWDEHYQWSPIYVNLPWGVSKRIATWEPWPLGPYASALWTVTLK